MENEKRLIYAEDALEAEFSIEADGAIGFVVDSEVIRRLPTVDAVEVVRCKDCKKWEKCYSSIIGEVMCCTGQGNVKIQKGPDDFCSYGERRQGE